MSGAVGSIVVQLAKAKGCRVIESAGKADKIAWLQDKTGIDGVINYKETKDFVGELSKLASDGIELSYPIVPGHEVVAWYPVYHANDSGGDKITLVACRFRECEFPEVQYKAETVPTKETFVA